MSKNHRIAELITGLNISQEFVLLIEQLGEKLAEMQIATGVALGEKAPNFCLPNQYGKQICLEDILRQGPVVISFYRGSWCPVCRLELSAQQESLEEIKAIGGHLLAISPQPSAKACQLYESMGLSFDLLSDPENQVIQAYQLLFEVPDAWKPAHQYILKDHGSWQLPIPATFVLDQQGIVCGRYVSADYLTRMEPVEIIGTLERLLGKDHALAAYLHSKNEILRNTLKELQNAQEKLLKQEKKAAIGHLTAGLVHEIRNLLNPISLLELIKRDLSPKNAKYVDYIYDSRARILELIDDVRLMSKNEALIYETTAYPLEHLMKEGIELASLDEDVKNKSIELTSSYTGRVQVNKNKMIQVLLNLIRNAAQAIQHVEGGKIEIKTEQALEFGKISIIDNGIGMEQAVLEKIWQPFFTTKGESGTGLGLDISRKIIEQHGGKLECCSQKGVGTSFCFYVPIC